MEGCPEESQGVATKPGAMFATRTASSRVLGIGELLTMIFMSCLPEDDLPDYDEERDYLAPDRWIPRSNSHFKFPRRSEREAPLQLIHVCRHWRSWALKTPELWARIHLSFDREVLRSVHDLTIRLNILLFWLKHTQSVPVSIRCSDAHYQRQRRLSSSPNSEATNKILQEIIDAIYEQSHRWEIVQINLTIFGVDPFYGFMDRDYPHLKSLELIQYNSGWPDASSKPNIVVAFRSAPKLQNFLLTGLDTRHFVTAPSGLPSSLRYLGLSHTTLRTTECVRGSQVTELDLDNVYLSYADLSRFPAAFPFLRSFTYEGSQRNTYIFHWGEDAGGINSEPIVLDKLTKLKVKTRRGRSFPLDRLTTPALLHLTAYQISFEDSSEDFDEAVLQLIERSAAPIIYFSHSAGYETCKKMTAILKALPDLQFLNVRFPGLSTAALHLLENPSVCPNLVSIRSEGKFIVVQRMCPTRRLDLPKVRHILQFMDKRCCKRSNSAGSETGLLPEGPADERRTWIKQLALPVRERSYHMLREDQRFITADVQFENTNVRSRYDDEYSSGTEGSGNSDNDSDSGFLLILNV